MLLVALVSTVLLGTRVLGAAPWWSNGVFYRILVDSFKDEDGDGLGDLKGASKQISYVRALGADAVILSSLTAKNTDCSNPGILSHVELDQRYGNIEIFNKFIEKAKKLELKVIITMQLQTVSSASEWFTSSASQTPGYEDWIVWKDGTADDPPPMTNDENETWKWHEGRNAYWLASNNEAHLNLCSDGVTATLATSLCSWIRRGASGALLDPDFPKDQRCGEKLLRKMASEASSCARSANMDTPVILVESSLEPESAAKYYGDGGAGANIVISDALASPLRRSSPELALAFHAALLHAPRDLVTAWLTSTTNNTRISTRYGSDMVDAVNLLALVLPGAAIIQQGDELGAADTILEWVSSTDKCWPSPTTPAAAPFPWDDTTNAGFSAGDPWLPPAPNYRYANAKSEFANDFSHVGVVRVAAAMRKSPAMGPHVEINRLGDALAVLRWGGTGSLLTICNPTREQTEVLLSRIPGLPTEMTVATSSAGSSLTIETRLTMEKTLKLLPGETVLLAGAPRHCGGPGPVDKIANKLSEGWQKINKYFSNM